MSAGRAAARPGGPLGLVERVLDNFRTAGRDFWALSDVSLTVERGETLGVIGPNGAGKSTLFKLLSGITAPTTGEIRMRGRASALIELGSGFHPELTGRENVFSSGALLGMRRREISAKLSRIAEFADIGDFLDVPVKWYSSGMYVRLGFAVAAHLDPQILLVDEVLAVGDAAFQVKCFDRIAELRRRGVTILLISHDLAAVERLADRAVLLDRGRVVSIGSPRTVVATYQRLVEGGDAAHLDAGPGDATGDVEIAGMSIVSLGMETSAGTTGRPLAVRVRCRVREELPAAAVDLLIHSFHEGVLQCHCSSATEAGWEGLPAGDTVVEFYFPHLALQPGVYTLGATVAPGPGERPVAWSFGQTTLYVEDGPGVPGRFFMPYTCRLREAAGPRSELDQVGKAMHGG